MKSHFRVRFGVFLACCYPALTRLDQLGIVDTIKVMIKAEVLNSA